MKIVITGANGFIGSNLINYFNKKNIVPYCLVRKNADLSIIETINISKEGYKLIETDYSDINSINNALHDADIIIHLAALLKGFTYEDILSANLHVTENLINSARQSAKNLKRFIFISSQAACGPSNTGCVLNEDDHEYPITNYGKSKLEAENLVSKQSDIPWTILRPVSVFGPGDRITFKMFQMAANGIIFSITGKPRYYSVVSVYDVCEAIYLSINNKNAIHKKYFVSTDGKISMKEMYLKIMEHLPKKRRIIIPLTFPPFLIKAYGHISEYTARLLRFKKLPFINIDRVNESIAESFLASNDKIKKELRFNPSKGIDSVFKEATSWYLKNGWL
jgi:nucleoside-diphosphate-sugar epimerase